MLAISAEAGFFFALGHVMFMVGVVAYLSDLVSVYPT